MSRDAWARYGRAAHPHYDVVMPGFKYNMMDLQAAIGLQQLARIDAMHARRARDLAAVRRRGLAALPLGAAGAAARGDVHARHLYTVLVDPRFARPDARRRCSAHCSRPASRRASTSARCTCTPTTASASDFRRGMFPHAEPVSDSTLSLPLSAAMTDAGSTSTIVVGSVVEVLAA